MLDNSQAGSQNNTTEQNNSERDLFVVGIGASAGGLSALEELFDHLPADTGAAFVVIQHLSPNFKSLMKELLERHTAMNIYRVTQGMKLKPNSVFLIPPGKNLIVEANVLKLQARRKVKHELNFPIDLFFDSLARNCQEKAIGVILSGSGSDGTHGLRAINEAGGIALVQEPSTAEFDGMPLSAVATGVVNQILPVPELAKLIHQCIISPHHFSEVESTEEDLLTYSNLKKIASILLDSEKIDFSQYKASTISRRIHRRRLINNLEDISSYIQVLNNSPVERRILCSDLLINVTHFFRDRSAWKTIENVILPDIIARAEPNTELRFWVAGCSTGEEAYSLAILIHEALQNNPQHLRVKIFATDIDRTALEIASAGIYAKSIVKDISPERLQKYFVPNDNSYQITKKIRELLIFSSHNLTKDAVFTRLHFASCRNVLIYMQSKLQLQILRNFHFALRPKGVLLLGEAESVGQYESEFVTLDKKWKIYQKRRDIRLPITNHNFTKPSGSSIVRSYHAPIERQTKPVAELSLQRLLGKSNSVILIVNDDNRLLHVYGDSSQILKPHQGEIKTDVTRMVHESLQLPLNTALHRAKKEQKTIEYAGIRFIGSTDNYQAKLTVIPPESNDDEFDSYVVEVKIKVVEKPIGAVSKQEFQANSDAQRRIFALEQELQQTRENLQALVEELETTNEEQQASNEELTASNEELQSTNEELHSVNEELHTVNIEYQSKISELIQLNNDIDNLLKSTDIGVIFLDSEFNIRKFTPAATVAISLRNTDIERPLSEINLKIDCENLEQLLVEVCSTNKIIEREVKLKTEDSYLLMRIHPYLTDEAHHNGLVISFVGINEVKLVQLQLEATLKELKNKETEINNFFELSLEIMCVANLDGYFKRINPSFQNILGYTTEELMTQPFINFVHPDDVEATLQAVQQLSAGQEIIGFENRYRCQDGSYRWIRWMAAAYEGLIYATAHDLTEEKLAQELQNRQLAAIETATDGIAILNEDKYIYINQAHLNIFGYSQPEELLGQSWRILYESERINEFEQEIFPVLQDKGKWQGVVKAKHRNGHTFDEELTLTFSKTGDLICVCQDISEIIQARQKLVESNLQLENRVVERTEVLATFSDRLKQIHRLSTSNYPDLSALFADYLQTGCQMFGMSTGIVSEINNYDYKVVGVESPLDITVESQFDCKDTYCSEVISSLSTVTFERVGAVAGMQNHPVYLNLKLESYIGTPILVNGEFYGTLNFSDTNPRENPFSQEEKEIIELMAIDIGQSIATKENAAALAKTTAHFRNTFEQAALGIAHISLEGKFMIVNSGLCQMLGYEKEALEQLTFQAITHPDDAQLDEETRQQLLKGEIDSRTWEKRYFHRDSSIVWINLTASVIRDNLGEPEYFIYVIEDISERKQTEIALLESQKQLKQANQAKDRFIAHMSHELRTPLNSILGFSHILKKDSRLIPEQLKSVDLINQSGQHLLTLINDILDLSKLNANKLELQPRDLNLANFIHNIATIFSIRAQEKGLDFQTQISDELPVAVSVDETKLRQILLNLLSNALKFTFTGKVTLSVNCFSPTLKSDFKTVRFAVEDTGIGIPQDEYDNIFQPFGQIDSNSHDLEGTGLGLPICQSILNLMDSKLHLGSKVGRGSHFWFDLDLKEVWSHTFPIPTNPEENIVRTLAKPCKVLVVDDNQDNRSLLLEYLQALGFTVKEARDGREGIKIAEEFQPDVILADLMMPVMNGQEMIEAIRRDNLLKDTVIVVISANTSSIIDSSDINCDGFLAKPVDLELLEEILEEHLQLDWQAERQRLEVSNERELTNLLYPVEEKLLELLELVNYGNMDAILKQINLLEKEDLELTSFSQKVRQLATSCQQEKLKHFLEVFLNKTK